MQVRCATILLVICSVGGITACRADTGRSEADGVAEDWRAIGGFGDPDRQLLQTEDVTYARIGSEGATEMFRSSDGGATWGPLLERGFDRVLAETRERDAFETIQFRRTSKRAFAVVGDELYRETSAGFWSSRPIDLPGFPEKLTSVGDRLVCLFDGQSPLTEHLAFSRNGGASWRIQKTFEFPPLVRSWRDKLFVAESDSAPHGSRTAGTTVALHRWDASSRSWSVREGEPTIGLTGWAKVGEWFYSISFESEQLSVSSGGFEWDDVPVDSSARKSVRGFPVPEVMGETQKSPGDVFVLLQPRGEVGLIDVRGRWKSLTPQGPFFSWDGSVATVQSTGRGVLMLKEGLTFRWSAGDRRWSTVDIAGRDAVPEQLVVSESGRLVARSAGELFVGNRGGWTWRRNPLDAPVSKIVALEDGSLLAHAARCLYRESSGSGGFEPVRGSGGADCDEAYPWSEHHGATLSSVVQGPSHVYLGFEAYGYWSEPSECNRTNHCGGGLYRLSVASGEIEPISDDALLAEEMPRPWAEHLEFWDGRLWVEGVHGLAVSADAGRTWTSTSNTVVRAAPRAGEEFELQTMEATQDRLYGTFAAGDPSPASTPEGPGEQKPALVLAERRSDRWIPLAEQPDGDLHDVDAAADRLYVATSRGIFYRADTSNEWVRSEGEVPGRAAAKIAATDRVLAATDSKGHTWRRVRIDR